jgi:tRNA threonylcarbamoyladenosine biosynthesis protein TsaE
MKEIRTHSAEQTVEIGKAIGSILGSGDLVCLTGDLGTGKTAFTNGIADAIGIKGYITSPTFTIVNEYTGRVPMYHFDVYRIADPEEMFEIGFEEYLDSGGIVVIEWAELIKDILPRDCIWVKIEKDIRNGADERIISVEFTGERYKGYEERLSVITGG